MKDDCLHRDFLGRTDVIDTGIRGEESFYVSLKEGLPPGDTYVEHNRGC